MLFNTLAYAKFFAFVFVACWLLVQRRNAVWLPWLALLATVVFVPGLQGTGWAWGVVGAAFTLTFTAARSRGSVAGSGASPPNDEQEEATPSDDGPDPAALLGSVALNGVALIWVLWRLDGRTVFDWVLGALRVPVPPILSGAVTPLAATAGLFAFWRLLRARRVRLLFVLLASYVFYAGWDYRFVALIFASSSVDYWLGLKIGRATDPLHKKRWLWLTVIVNLGVLAVFKYLNFGIETAEALLTSIGVDVEPATLRVALPVGISFFTFESMSYVIDVYRGQLPPHESYLEYLSFVAFFPHLVAGPIVRPRDLLPQLGGAPRFSAEHGSEALYLIAWGLLKKVAIADTLALNLVDRVFDAPAQYSSLECYVAVLGYAVQIYCDFSGYTDVAIGSALLLGVRFPLNFNSPYKAQNIQDFWRRWHISLSTWLRDYLYIPLGGNRRGESRTVFNLMVTMLLGGLWHGANWTFVVWGGLHGAALALTRWARSRPPSEAWWRPVLGVALTFHFVCFAWVFFRAENFDKAWAILRQLSQGTHYVTHLHALPLVVLACGLVLHWLPETWYQRTQQRFIALPAAAQGLALGAVALVLRELSNAEAVPFVYFQF